jgi:hypothetical protein
MGCVCVSVYICIYSFLIFNFFQIWDFNQLHTYLRMLQQFFNVFIV